MVKILGLLLLLVTVKAQILFPGEIAEDETAPAEEVPEASDTELFEALDINTRQNINTFGSSSCVTPNGERGTCQSFSSCPAYVAMRRNLHRPSVLNFLRGRICRRLRRTVHLCCTNAGTPPTASNPSPSNSGLQQQCGSVPLANRVVGGVETVPGEWPWLAAVGNRVGNTFSAGCAGTLITRRHVLSAGHCFAPGQPIPTMVRLGAYDLTRRTSSVPPQDFNIRDRRDGGYNPRTNEDDITILILDHDATLNDYVQIACLPFNLRSRSLLRDSLVVTGWGRTRFENPQTSNIPMKAVVPVRDTATCSAAYQKLPANRRPVIDGRSLCAGDGKTDSCAGDSGGPLHYLDLNDGKYYVVGIVSFGVGCARPDFPGVYTRVTSFLDWIERNTQ